MLDVKGVKASENYTDNHKKYTEGLYQRLYKDVPLRGAGYQIIEEDEDVNAVEDTAAQYIANLETAQAQTFVLPKTMTVTVKFGYEKSMKDQLAALGTDFQTFIDAAMTHVQVYYHDPSLTTQINFEVYIFGIVVLGSWCVISN